MPTLHRDTFSDGSQRGLFTLCNDCCQSSLPKIITACL